MKDAQIRMESETREAGELPIEDKRIDERDEQQVALRQKGEQEVEVLKSVSQSPSPSLPVSHRPALPSTPPPEQPPGSFLKSSLASEGSTPAISNGGDGKRGEEGIGSMEKNIEEIQKVGHLGTSPKEQPRFSHQSRSISSTCFSSKLLGSMDQWDPVFRQWCRDLVFWSQKRRDLAKS